MFEVIVFYILSIQIIKKIKFISFQLKVTLSIGAYLSNYIFLIFLFIFQQQEKNCYSNVYIGIHFWVESIPKS